MDTLRFALLLSFLGFAPSLLADWYQVEVIVFQHVNVQTDGEFWDENPGLPDREGSIQLIEAGGAEAAVPANSGEPERVPYQALPDSRYRLDGIEQVLGLSREYRPVLHVAWQQPGTGSERSRAVHLERLKIEQPVHNAPVPAPSEPGVAGPVYVVPESLLEGTLRLRVSRFLHVDVDMAFFPETVPAPPVVQPSAGAEGGVPQPNQSADYVRLRQSRKILLNELHYFDHPLFGIIVQVSRLQLPEASGDHEDRINPAPRI